jgi:hypothetical protein
MPIHLAFLWHRRHIKGCWIREEVTMTTAALDMAQSLSRRQAPARSTAGIGRCDERSGNSPADEPATVTAPFQPLDLDIVSAAIPAFFIGRNKDGLWVARDAKGKAGGLFLFERSALSFARRNSRPTGHATIYPSEGFELDLGNTGNPLAARLATLKRLAMRVRQRIVALIGG